MSTIIEEGTTSPAGSEKGARTWPKLVGLLSIVAGILLIVTGAGTWYLVSDQLAAENITVAEDAEWFAGEPVDGPLTAYSQAQIINDHALESTEGLTYAQMDREDPLRAVAMNASFLRASLFTSVVSYGVAAMAMGIGAVFVLNGVAFRSLARS